MGQRASKNDESDSESDSGFSRDEGRGATSLPKKEGIVWNTFNSVKEGVNLALSLTSTHMRRRVTLRGPELEVAMFLSSTTPVDFTEVLSVEILVHIFGFVDGEDLVALEQSCKGLYNAVGDCVLWKDMLEAKRRQITFVPFISEQDRVEGCRNWEEKHRYFKSCVWNSIEELPEALLVAEHSRLGGEIHLLEGVYKSVLLEGWGVDVSIIGHGEVVVENSSAWRPPIHVCSESSLNPSAFMREQLSLVGGYIPETISRMNPVTSSMLPEYFSGLFRTRRGSPTIVFENLIVKVGALADQISTFPVYVEGQTHVIIHRCHVEGQRLSAILVSKGAQCDVIDSDIGNATEDGVFYVCGGGSVIGCRIHNCAMNAIEVRGASRNVVIERNIITGNGCGVHVPLKEREAATNLSEMWNGKVFFRENQVFDNVGPSTRIEKCQDNPHMEMDDSNTIFGNAEQRPTHALKQALENGICTRSVTGDRHDYQPWYECLTCKLDLEHLESGICQSCVERCHKDHVTYQRWTHTRSFCDCIHTAKGCECQEEGLALDLMVEEESERGVLEVA
jgi:hypothetical protein